MLGVIEQYYEESSWAAIDLAFASPVFVDPLKEILCSRPESIKSANDGSICIFLKIICENWQRDLNRRNFIQLVNQKRLGFGGCRGFGVLRKYNIFVREGRGWRRLSPCPSSQTKSEHYGIISVNVVSREGKKILKMFTLENNSLEYWRNPSPSFQI